MECVGSLPFAVIANLVEVLAKVDTLATPCLVHHVEADQIVLHVILLRNHEVTTSIVQSKLTFLIGCSKTFVPSTDTGFWSNLEVDVLSYLFCRNQNREDRIVVWILTAIRELIVGVIDIPTVKRTNDVVSFIDERNLWCDGQCARTSIYVGTLAVDHHIGIDMSINVTGNGTLAIRVSYQFLQHILFKVTLSVDSFNLITFNTINRRHETDVVDFCTNSACERDDLHKTFRCIQVNGDTAGCEVRDRDGLLLRIGLLSCPVLVVVATGCHKQPCCSE